MIQAPCCRLGENIGVHPGDRRDKYGTPKRGERARITDSDQTTFPVKAGPSLSYGGVDAFVAKVRADGTVLDYCGYIGGSKRAPRACRGVPPARRYRILIARS